MDSLKKIVLTENFDLREVLDQLLESRGVIDGIDEMTLVITNYINDVLKKKEYYKGYDKENDVDKYRFTIPSYNFDNVEILFMKSPLFTINLFVMRSRYGDMDRELGPTNYSATYHPKIINVDGAYYLQEPEFELSYNVRPDIMKLDSLTVADKLSHEIAHAKKNFYEFIRFSKKRKESMRRGFKMIELLNNEDKDSLESLVGRVLYLCSDDEINARANQLYYQLKRFRYLDNSTINQAVKNTKTYELVEEMEEKINELSVREEKMNSVEFDYIIEILKDIYRFKKIGKNPYEFLINLIIVQKNKFIRQIDKVKEKVLYENLTMPLKMINPPK